jgi:hypothetical protein
LFVAPIYFRDKAAERALLPDVISVDRLIAFLWAYYLPDLVMSVKTEMIGQVLRRTKALLLICALVFSEEIGIL